jgi:hypothetical protein
MWRNNRTSKALVIVVCLLIVGLAGCGNSIGSHGGNVTRVASSHAYTDLSSSLVKTNAFSRRTTNVAPFKVTSIDMYVSPTDVSLWKCGSYIQVVYNAVFHVDSGPNGGIIQFSYTLNNGRSQTAEQLTIIPGQQQSNFVFTWQGSLPSDHTYPGPGGVLVTSPNYLLSSMVYPTGKCS